MVKIGDTYTIVVDKQPFIQVAASSMEALLVYLSVFYVFYIHWNAEVKGALLFLQSELIGDLDKGDPEFIKHNALQVFLKQFRAKMAAANNIDEEESSSADDD